MVQAYLASISFVDHYVGEVLEALEKSQYADNTIVVLWGDHGYDVGEKNRFAKMSLWETTTKTTLIIKPAKNSVKSVSNRPVSLLDLYPTLVKMCGLPMNPANQGHDITPLLHNPQEKWDKVVITTFGPNNHAIRSDRYRYIHYEDGSEELYDHTSDPNEWYNLAGNPSYRAVKNELKKRLPDVNAPWSPVSQYTSNDYFKKLTENANAN